MKIIVAREGECIQYAADELKKYIVALSCGNINPEIFYGMELAFKNKAEDEE